MPEYNPGGGNAPNGRPIVAPFKRFWNVPACIAEAELA